MKMITKEIERKMGRFPLYSQDGKGDEAEVICKIFNPYGGQRLYVLEAGVLQPDGDRELFVLTTENGEKEYGYMMMTDLTDTRVNVFGCMLPFERDRYFSGTVADALKDSGI